MATRNATSVPSALYFCDLRLDERGDAIERERRFAGFLARGGEPLVELLHARGFGVRIAEARHVHQPLGRGILWLRRPGRRGGGLVLGFGLAHRRRRKRRAALGLAEVMVVQLPLPQLAQFRVTRLDGQEPEAVGGVLDVLAIEFLDQRVDALARFERLPRLAAGQVHVVLGLEALDLAVKVAFISRSKSFVGGATR